MKTIDAARGKWQQILPQLGIDSRHLKKEHGPCPACGGTDRFRFDDKNGNGTWYCNGCDPKSGNGINLLMNVYGWDFAKAASEVDQVVGNCESVPVQEEKKPDPVIRLKKVREGLKHIGGINPVSIYLNNRELPKSTALMLHPRQAYYDNGSYKGSFPAMVAVFSAPDGKPLTFHITYLTQHGTKADVDCPKKVLPSVGPLQGGAIRLFDPAKTMGIAEGIETALACYKLFGVPTWASYSANLLEQFEPPEECEHLIIFGDSDSSYTGQKSAYALANRLTLDQRIKVKVEVRMCKETDQDWADVLTSNAG